MATKAEELSNPTSCLNKALEHEPVFVLIASDPLAAEVVRYWASIRIRQRGPEAKTTEALQHADRMEQWRADQLAKVFEDNGDAIIEAGGVAPRRSRGRKGSDADLPE